jgi:hypothetical protein
MMEITFHSVEVVFRSTRSSMPNFLGFPDPEVSLYDGFRMLSDHHSDVFQFRTYNGTQVHESLVRGGCSYAIARKLTRQEGDSEAEAAFMESLEAEE